MKRSYALPETSKLIGCIHVGEQYFVNLDLPRLELCEGRVQRQLACRKSPLEYRQRGLPERGRQWAGLRDRGVGAGLCELVQDLWGDERRVDREHDDELGRRSA